MRHVTRRSGNADSGSLSPQPPRTAPSFLGSPRRILWKFAAFSCIFSVNFTAVTAVLAYAQLFFGDMAPVAFAVYYGVFTGTALLAAAAITEGATPKYALCAGFALYCVFVAGFTVGGGFPAVRSAALVIGAVVGGFAGFIWAAQGAYFKAFAGEYARASGISASKANGLLAGIFAFVLLACETTMKSGAILAFSQRPVAPPHRQPAPSPPPPPGRSNASTGSGAGDGSAPMSLHDPAVLSLFVAYSVLAVLAAAASLWIPFVPVSPPSRPAHQRRWWQKVAAVLRLLLTNPRAILLAPAQLSFAFCVELVALYVSAEVSRCTSSFGTVDVFPKLPWLVAAIPAVAAVLQVPSGLLVRHCGSIVVPVMMVIGQASFAAIGALCAFVSRDELAGWGFGLASIYILQGVGRAANDGANRATYASMFSHEDAPAAFASGTLFGGIGSMLSYVLAPRMLSPGDSVCTYAGQPVPNYDGAAYGWVSMCCGAVGLVCYLAALALHRRVPASATAHQDRQPLLLEQPV